MRARARYATDAGPETIPAGTVVEVLRVVDAYEGETFLLCRLPNGAELEYSADDLVPLGRAR